MRSASPVRPSSNRWPSNIGDCGDDLSSDTQTVAEEVRCDVVRVRTKEWGAQVAICSAGRVLLSSSIKLSFGAVHQLLQGVMTRNLKSCSPSNVALPHTRTNQPGREQRTGSRSVDADGSGQGHGGRPHDPPRLFCVNRSLNPRLGRATIGQLPLGRSPFEEARPSVTTADSTEPGGGSLPSTASQPRTSRR
jgi:hypothetical protein